MFHIICLLSSSGMQGLEVQIHYVPLLCMTYEIGRFLGRMIGTVLEIDTGPKGECKGKFLRVRIRSLDHATRKCLEQLEEGIGSVSELLYGAWLKATPPRVKGIREVVSLAAIMVGIIVETLVWMFVGATQQHAVVEGKRLVEKIVSEDVRILNYSNVSSGIDVRNNECNNPSNDGSCNGGDVVTLFILKVNWRIKLMWGKEKEVLEDPKVRVGLGRLGLAEGPVLKKMSVNDVSNGCIDDRVGDGALGFKRGKISHGGVVQGAQISAAGEVLADRTQWELWLGMPRGWVVGRLIFLKQEVAQLREWFRGRDASILNHSGLTVMIAGHWLVDVGVKCVVQEAKSASLDSISWGEVRDLELRLDKSLAIEEDYWEHSRVFLGDRLLILTPISLLKKLDFWFFGMPPTIAPGQDGLPTLFYQKCWDVVGDIVIEACLKILNDEEEMGLINKTLICLIPKMQVAERITDYMPISLCNVIYKIVAKALANRLHTVLGELKGWRNKLLSVGGKEVVVKTVLQSMPAYSMNLFKLPNKLIDDIHRIFNRFWWGSIDSKNCVHWVAWRKLCWGKEDVGMGFHDLHVFNSSLLAKQGWRMDKNPESLTARVMRSYNYPFSTFMRADISVGGSQIWKGLCWGRGLLDTGSRWMIGTGSLVSIFEERWIPRPSTFKVLSPKTRDDICLVRHLKYPSGSWNDALLLDLFVKDDIGMIKSIPSSNIQRDDSYCWHFSSDGNYTVKSGYKLRITLNTNSSPSCGLGNGFQWRKI
ncbi:hypothetical protein Dsin_028569 [Dipteronia sinensis]|uniref:Uncharacterized protein n=1 Tax=Dipteronia sinensis TaxID=43782 RepID=A0AAE0DUD7_9ROSI|nr:hypothetical protein Dsin_028569 [Dipteronia sinensis]